MLSDVDVEEDCDDDEASLVKDDRVLVLDREKESEELDVVPAEESVVLLLVG